MLKVDAELEGFSGRNMNQCVSERPPKKQKKNLGMVVGLRA
jgi:hypothetical protein